MLLADLQGLRRRHTGYDRRIKMDRFAFRELRAQDYGLRVCHQLCYHCPERGALYALPIADIDPSERPNPPTVAASSSIGPLGAPMAERATGGIGTQLVPTSTSRVTSTSPSPSMASLVAVPPTPPPEIAASFGTSVVNAAADILVPPVTVTSFATAGFMAGGIVGREVAEAQAGPLLGDLGEMAGQTVGATAGTAVGSALVGCAKRSTSVPSRPVPSTQHPLPIQPLDMDRLSDVHSAESGTRGRSPRNNSMTQRFLMTPSICDRRRRRSPRDESLMITPTLTTSTRPQMSPREIKIDEQINSIDLPLGVQRLQRKSTSQIVISPL